MIGRGFFVVAILSNCVLSLPLTPSQLENEDAEVMKCIVEALADVLSRPHPMPVSQECLVTLKTDDRLVSILRHHNFLKELQEIAVQGGQGRTQLHGDAGTPDPTTPAPQTAGYVADRSMLEALGGPGERSILSQKKRMGNGDRGEEKDESPGGGESPEDNEIAEEVEAKRESDERTGGHISESADEESEGKAEKREEEEEEYEEKRVNSEEDLQEEHMTKDKKGGGLEEKRDAPRHKPKEKKSDGEDDVVKDKRSALSSHKEEQEQEQEEEEDEGEMKRGSREGLKLGAKRGKASQMRKKSVGGETQRLGGQREVPHHSKEVTEEEEEEEEEKERGMQRSPEERELQMIARRGPEERRVSEEEGSASRKSEEPEIESLAAIESELENVAQKLHELRRG